MLSILTLAVLVDFAAGIKKREKGENIAYLTVTAAAVCLIVPYALNSTLPSLYDLFNTLLSK